MKATLENPIYTAYIISGGTKYNITGALESISFSDQKKQFSKSATLRIVNIKSGDAYLSSIIKVRDRVYIYANDGTTSGEVYRGYVWTVRSDTATKGNILQLRCYDNLIYMQESEESEFFSSGKSTKDIMSSLCSKWGVKLEYTYSSITHSKLALRGNLSDIITSDILDLVQDRTGINYVILSDKDTMQIKAVGSNTTIYEIKSSKNAIEASSECTMDGMTTKVVILGKADDDDRQPVEATVSGDTKQYGTLQKLINRDENTSLADAKKEAQSVIDEDGKPKWSYEQTVPDIPWMRKGDKVNVATGDISTALIVTGIDRSITNSRKEMTLTMEKIREPVKEEKQSETTSSAGDKPALKRVLKNTTPRMCGSDVTWLQTRLKELGYDCGDIDGVYGPATRHQVKKFQKANGLAQDGDCGPLTWAKL